jgi:hypothetical protein
VPGDIGLDRLHLVIQATMGWEGDHMHQFINGHTFYGQPHPDFEETLNEKDHTLRDLAPTVKKKLIYEYDFGDSWHHEVTVEKVLSADPNFKYPVCLAGENACPPEDCGGIPGYYRLLEVIADPKNPEYEEMREWVGEEFDPTRFDADQANRFLKQIKT